MTIFLILALAVAPFSFAQIDTSSTQAIIQGIVKGVPGATVNGVGTGAVVTRGGTVLVPASGLKIPIPVSIAANVGKARILAGALGCTSNPLGAILCAATVAQVASQLMAASKGYSACPSGTTGYACKPSPAPQPSGNFTLSGCASGGAISASTVAALSVQCNANFQAYWQAHGYPSCASSVQSINYTSHVIQVGYCGTNVGNYTYGQSNLSCPSGYTLSGQTCVPGVGAAVEPVTQTDIDQTLQERMNADYQSNRQLYEALKRDQADALANGRPWADAYNPVDSATGIVVTASPVTTPERTTSTQTRTLPSGETETETRKEVTTITPQTTGTTVGDSKTIYRTSTVITTTITNNTTNVTNTSTETVTDEVPPEEKPDPCPPNTDLVSCSRLGQIPDKETIPNVDVPVTYLPVVFQSNASCPAAVTFSAPIIGARSISWQPFCDVMGQLRPLFLACAAAACAWIFLDGMKGV